MTSSDTTTEPTARALRLRALDDEDLHIVSAMVQDAIVPVRDIGYDSEHLRFAMVINRFMWERCSPEAFEQAQTDADADADADVDEGREGSGGGATDSATSTDSQESFFRTLSAVRFEQVSRVEQRGIDQTKSCEMLDLLAIEQRDEHTVEIHFAGEGSIRLTMVKMECHFEDLGEAWPTQCRPVHELDGSRTVACQDEADHVGKFGEPAKADG